MSDPVVTIGDRERPWVSIFGERYEFILPDEATIVERNKMRDAGTALDRLKGKAGSELTDLQQQRIVEASRDIVRVILPGLPEARVKMLRIGEMAQLAGKWNDAFGTERP